MNVGRAIGYVFHDPHWARKVLIGGLLFFIPIFGWLVIPGYWLRVVRDVSRGSDVSMPEWDEFLADFVRGLKWWVVTFIWSIPIWVIEILELASNRSGSDYTSILAIIIWFFLPLANSRLALSGSIGEAIDFIGIFQESSRTIGPLLLVLVMTFLLGFLSFFGVFFLHRGYSLHHLYLRDHSQSSLWAASPVRQSRTSLASTLAVSSLLLGSE